MAGVAVPQPAPAIQGCQERCDKAVVAAPRPQTLVRRSHQNRQFFGVARRGVNNPVHHGCPQGCWRAFPGHICDGEQTQGAIQRDEIEVVASDFVAGNTDTAGLQKITATEVAGFLRMVRPEQRRPGCCLRILPTFWISVSCELRPW